MVKQRLFCSDVMRKYLKMDILGILFFKGQLGGEVYERNREIEVKYGNFDVQKFESFKMIQFIDSVMYCIEDS